VAGFGRSGTTWVSDIISKSLGGLVLFEPDHPTVFQAAAETIYSAQLPKSELDSLISSISNKEIKNNWLLRNHLPDGNMGNDYLCNEIWKRSEIIGLKCIRWNHDLTTLAEISDARLVYVIRHPLAVLASLLGRPRFFEEFGWDWHWHHFKQRNPLPEMDLVQYDDSTKVRKYAVMWTISNIKALLDLEILGIQPLAYEALYRHPYEESTRLLDRLGYANVRLHPSYLFYPSMSTLKTFHSDAQRWDIVNDNLRVFWSDTFTNKERYSIIRLIEDIVQHFPTIHATFKSLNYL